ncbi:MAG: DUF6788 family protein [Promethearchaeota archaeon]
MASIIAKFQRCGKTNCHCYTSGSLHGPYFWLVIYVRFKYKKGKYKWKYLGKDPQRILVKLKDLGVPCNFSREHLDAKISTLKERTLNSGNISKKNFSTKIFNLEQKEVNAQLS